MSKTQRYLCPYCSAELSEQPSYTFWCRPCKQIITFEQAVIVTRLAGQS